jgi:ribonuclease BN (tRNA processing enzyme)
MASPLTILGAGGWFPAHGRQTACALLRQGDHAMMIDAGTGVGRLAERPELLHGVHRLDLVLTHFHLDHVCGLAYLPSLDECPETTIWGPGAALYGTRTRDVLDRLSHEPFHPVPLEAQRIEVRDLPVGELELSGIRIATRAQTRHSAPTLGLRFGDDLAWITDTAHDPESAAFARGCATLAHEAWFPSSHPRNPDIHTAAADAAVVAADAGAGQLLLIHLPPFKAGTEPLLEEARARMPATEAAIDGWEIDIDLRTPPALG